MAEEKYPPYQFFPCNFSEQRNSLQKFLTFSFNSPSSMLQHSNAITSAIPKLQSCNQNHPTIFFFLSNLFEIEVVITLSHKNAKVTKLWSVMSETKIMTSRPFLKITFTLKRPRVHHFPDIIKIAIMFIKTTF